MTFSRYSILLTGIITLQIIATTMIWIKLDNKAESLAPNDADKLAEVILQELKSYKKAAQNIDASPDIAAIKAPGAEELQEIIRNALEKELGEILKKAQAQTELVNNQAGSSIPQNQAQNTHFRGKTEVPLGSDQLQRREEAMSQTTTIIDQAIENGSWEPADNEKLLPYIAQLSDEQRIELLEKFYGALNNQTLTLKDGMPPPL